MSRYFTTCPSPIGELIILSNGEAITAVDVDRRTGETTRRDDLPVLISAKNWLERYFAGNNPDPSELPVAPEGTAFQQTVWSLLRQIPYGKTVTYGSLAAKTAAILNKPRMSPQAIGGAVGRNPVLILIPCHRVLGADDKLTGFSAGIERKITLLELEKIPFK